MMTPIHSLTCFFYIMPENKHAGGTGKYIWSKGQRGRKEKGGHLMLKLCSLTFKNYTPNPRTDFFIQKGFRVHSDHFTHKFH